MSDSDKPSFLDGLLAGFAEGGAKPAEADDLEVEELKQLLAAYELDTEQMVTLSMWLFGQSVKLAFKKDEPRDE